MEMNIIYILRYFLEYEVQIVTVIKPFHATDLFLYPLKVFWCFQGVSKEISGRKWVKGLVAKEMGSSL